MGQAHCALLSLPKFATICGEMVKSIDIEDDDDGPNAATETE